MTNWSSYSVWGLDPILDALEQHASNGPRAQWWRCGVGGGVVPCLTTPRRRAWLGPCLPARPPSSSVGLLLSPVVDSSFHPHRLFFHPLCHSLSFLHATSSPWSCRRCRPRAELLRHRANPELYFWVARELHLGDLVLGWRHFFSPPHFKYRSSFALKIAL
jgi:hypothetical protein